MMSLKNWYIGLTVIIVLLVGIGLLHFGLYWLYRWFLRRRVSRKNWNLSKYGIDEYIDSNVFYEMFGAFLQFLLFMFVTLPFIMYLSGFMTY